MIEEVGSHAGNITDVITDKIGPKTAGVTRVFFRNAFFNLPVYRLRYRPLW
jgi:hypothetical protein